MGELGTGATPGEKEGEPMRILPRYIKSRFVGLFLFCLLSAFLVFLIVDLVENFDQFIDNEVPRKIAIQYYVYYTPYILVLTFPIATLLATVFSIGSFARHNEMVALKSLGYSLYQVIGHMMVLGFILSLVSFLLAEGIGADAVRKKEEIRKAYLERRRGNRSQLRNLEIQEPPDMIISIGYLNVEKGEALRVKIETFDGHLLVSRLDAPAMRWDGEAWIVNQGYLRSFEEGLEQAQALIEPRRFFFRFNPRELMMAQVKPDEMSFVELLRFVRRVQETGGEVYRWMTDLHLRIAFPFSNFIIIFFSVPLVYNRRKRSLSVGFGISLVICKREVSIRSSGHGWATSSLSLEASSLWPVQENDLTL